MIFKFLLQTEIVGFAIIIFFSDRPHCKIAPSKREGDREVGGWAIEELPYNTYALYLHMISPLDRKQKYSIIYPQHHLLIITKLYSNFIELYTIITSL